MKILSKKTALRRLAALFGRMQDDFAKVAAPLGFTCEACPENCCQTHFQHHTYLEWLFLWEGFSELDAARQEEILANARRYVSDVNLARSEGRAPLSMCPLIVDGKCGLYSHRLMICRLFGVDNVLLGPKGMQTFSGCARFRGLAGGGAKAMDRTPFYRELAGLEIDFLRQRRSSLPRVDLTIAEMLLAGPPKL